MTQNKDFNPHFYVNGRDNLLALHRQGNRSPELVSPLSPSVGWRFWPHSNLRVLCSRGWCSILSCCPAHSNIWPPKGAPAWQDRLRPVALSFEASWTCTSCVLQRLSLPEASPTSHTLNPEEASLAVLPSPPVATLNPLLIPGPSESSVNWPFGSPSDTQGSLSLTNTMLLPWGPRAHSTSGP